MKFFSFQDARGRESRTLFFVRLSWLVVTLRMILGGVVLKMGPLEWGISTIDAASYGAAVAAILAIWVGREWKQKSLDADEQK